MIAMHEPADLRLAVRSTAAMRAAITPPRKAVAPRASQARSLLVPLLLALAGWFVLPVDLGIAQWSLLGNCPDVLDKWFSLCEVVAHGLGVAAILATVAILDPGHRFVLPRLIAASFGAGLLANITKLIVARVRPHSFPFDGTVSDTFSHWLPLWNAGSQFQGFPSAHMATAAGLAVGLAWLYPRGRWLFLFLAVSAGGQRVVSGDHFPSDVLWGAALGSLFATGLFNGGPLSRWFDRMGRRSQTVSQASRL
jgi:membrane-associated phospholipid phosphatase